MPSTLVIILLSALLVGGLYSLTMWLDLFGIRQRQFWTRVALASGAGHVVLVTAFIVLAYVDFGNTRELIGSEIAFSAFLFNDPDVWRIFLWFDVLAALLVLAVLGVLDATGSGAGAVLPLALISVFVIGTAQWYAVGGIFGAAVSRLVSGLRTPDDDMPDWF